MDLEIVAIATSPFQGSHSIDGRGYRGLRKAPPTAKATWPLCGRFRHKVGNRWQLRSTAVIANHPHRESGFDYQSLTLPKLIPINSMLLHQTIQRAPRQFGFLGGGADVAFVLGE